MTYPPIGDYGLIADGHCAALVSSSGSVDWCCMPRLDAASTFGRLLDWETAGHCSISPGRAGAHRRAYVADTMVLETTFSSEAGEVRLLDCFTVR
ncbi:MAG: trehalase-like domain-containing protein, partial [Acidimicrobiales bacterium]